MTSTLSRFCCPACGAALTPWLRELTLGEAAATHASGTWLLPGGTFVRRDGPLQPAGPALANHPWLLPPIDERWLRPHPDQARTIGCCGMNYRPDLPNLTCPCGQEVGFGHRDCCGPHWYALHQSVLREQTDDPAPLTALDGPLAQLRALVAGPLPAITAWPPNNKSTYPWDVDTWKAAPRLRDVGLHCGGGVEAPMLMLRSMQLPTGTALYVPIRWPQLVRSLVLAEEPWGTPAVPLTWQADHATPLSPGPRTTTTVQLTRSTTTVLVTVWQGHDTWAVRISASRWRSAWARLRRRAAHTMTAV